MLKRAAETIAPAKCAAIQSALRRWFKANRRDLPWRHTSDPYRIWLSEVMLQQTQVRTMLPYYHRFLRRFPDVHSLARANLQTVLKLWEGLGYYSRARNMHRTAAIVSCARHGRFPDTKKGWMQLPGVGDYIASAVSSISAGLAHAVVDGNVKRVLARMFCIDQPVNQASAYPIFQATADRLLDARRPGDHNQAVMELGALVCTPRNPRCRDCPVSRHCCARARDTVSDYPRRETRAPLPVRHVAVGAVSKNGRILVVQRPNDGFLGGMWEFPGGSVGDGQDPAPACVQGILSAVNLHVVIRRHAGTVFHGYTHFKLQMEVFDCRWHSGRVYRRGPQSHRWIARAELDRLPLHGAMHKALLAVQ